MLGPGTTPCWLQAPPTPLTVTSPTATEGVSGAYTDPAPSTTTPGDPSAASPSIQPTPGAITWAVDGTGHSNALGDTAVASGYDPSIMAAATSTCIGGVTTGYAVPTMVGTMSAVGSPIHPAVGSSIMAITSRSATSEGAP